MGYVYWCDAVKLHELVSCGLFALCCRDGVEFESSAAI